MAGERERILSEVAEEFAAAGRLSYPPDRPESSADEHAFWDEAIRRLAKRGFATEWELRAMAGQTQLDTE
jgi:hypothetical protein